MEPQFTCQKCLKFFGPTRNLYEKVYKGQSLCMMCRKTDGQRYFTSEEKEVLFAEEAMDRHAKGT